MKAGIASEEFPDQLLIALEPEAASIYCRKLRMHQLVPESPRQVQSPTRSEPVNLDNAFEVSNQGKQRNLKIEIYCENIKRSPFWFISKH